VFISVFAREMIIVVPNWCVARRRRRLPFPFTVGYFGMLAGRGMFLLLSRDSEKNNKQNGTMYYVCRFIVIIPTRNRNLSRDRFEIRMGRVIKGAFISQDLCESGPSLNGNDALVSWSYNNDGNDGTTLASS
jgi:hypothetical protein